MPGEKLHKYDVALCNYALANISWHLDQPRFAAAVEKWFGRRILDYLKVETDTEQEELLLNDKEFYDLIELVEDEGPRPIPEWHADKPLHRRHVLCVKEIRVELTRQAAENWSMASTRFARRLERQGVRLVQGLKIISAWVRHLRRLLEAMGATSLLPYPVGQSPTLTNPASPRIQPPSATATPALTDQVAADIEIMRGLIAAHGAKAPAKTLIRHCGISERRARNALRKLEALGVYEGFAKKRPPRYPSPPDEQ
jgi:hypothetical protein